MNWRIKGIVQKALGSVPGGTLVNDQLQRTFGELRHVEKTVDSKVADDWLVLAGQLRELEVPIAGAEMVEIGTGWFPVFPLCFALAGARACHTYDLNRHLSATLTRRAIERIGLHLRRIADVSNARVVDVERRYAALRDMSGINEALQSLGVHYHAPADASATELPPSSVDVVFSNSVLEHVTPGALRAIFAESRRILKTGGLAIHSANCGDHYAYFDHSITAINYLRYSAREWRFWDNAMLYQNRLRPVDFLNIAAKEQLEIVLSRYTPKPKLMALLPSMPIAPEFSRYAPEELCSTSIDFAARRVAGR